MLIAPRPRMYRRRRELFWSYHESVRRVAACVIAFKKAEKPTLHLDHQPSAVRDHPEQPF
jgi:hypothetical protein